MSNNEEAKTFMKGVGIISTIIILLSVGLLWAWPNYKVYQQELVGEAALARATQERQIQIEQSKAELESAQNIADAIAIVGQAAKDYPEYRDQVFIGAFSEALINGNIEQIIYVPTEANIPIMEAGRNSSQQ